LSVRNAWTSSGVGGRPVKSSVARRNSVTLSAGAFARMPLAACAAFTIASIGFVEAGGAPGRAAAILGIGWKTQ